MQRFRRAIPRSPEWVTYHLPSRNKMSPDVTDSRYRRLKSSKHRKAIGERSPHRLRAISTLILTAFNCIYFSASLLNDSSPSIGASGDHLTASSDSTEPVPFLPIARRTAPWHKR